jgi:hypothetical protein
MPLRPLDCVTFVSGMRGPKDNAVRLQPDTSGGSRRSGLRGPHGVRPMVGRAINDFQHVSPPGAVRRARHPSPIVRCADGTRQRHEEFFPYRCDARLACSEHQGTPHTTHPRLSHRFPLNGASDAYKEPKISRTPGRIGGLTGAYGAAIASTSRLISASSPTTRAPVAFVATFASPKSRR